MSSCPTCPRGLIMIKNTNWIAVACCLGFCAVALGAFGAHGLEETLSEGKRAEWWSTAVDYHMWHALALLLVGLIHRDQAHGSGAGIAFTGGILIFSGSLYAMALGAPAWLGAVTPLGGLGFLTGWVLLGLSVRRPD